MPMSFEQYRSKGANRPLDARRAGLLPTSAALPRRNLLITPLSLFAEPTRC